MIRSYLSYMHSSMEFKLEMGGVVWVKILLNYAFIPPA